ncbi:MAG: hypothetical protein BGO66_02965 [Alicycliphilus sp. 69-12]|nr:MAG: hypothetical protein BGO66_02965 [Alicycliphilus sp. 69-12]
MSENIIDVRIDLVSTEGRFRKDFGDIPGLASSISEIGLLQPIGIDAGYRLVFGERRLKAFRHLGRDTIPARFVNLESLLKGEYAENEFRKDFTVSERVEIGKALEGELAQRVGVNQYTKGKENFPDPPQGQTRDLAAKAAGFGNGRTYEQAKAVIASGAPELVEELDAGRVSVSAAAKVAELPRDEQCEIIQQGRVKEVAKAARYIGKPKTGPKADAIREELAAAKERGVSMLCTYARLLLGAIRASESFTEEEREHLAEVAGAISQTKGVLHES